MSANTPLWTMLLVVFATMIGAFGTILLKKGSDQFSLRKPLSIFKNYKLIGGLSIFIFSSVLFIIALRAGQLSVLYPLVAVTYIWVALLSVYFLKEKMNWYKWLGILLIIFGVTLIGFGS
ncbi:MAG: EamA family transporter [Nanoarchaeota archaeon]|nr:EamA family transporter [Nanoarchaeota archaeon]